MTSIGRPYPPTTEAEAKEERAWRLAQSMAIRASSDFARGRALAIVARLCPFPGGTCSCLASWQGACSRGAKIEGNAVAVIGADRRPP